MPEISFIISSIFIIAAGIRLTEFCDLLSDRLNLGKALVGAILLAFVTSLPEAITSVISIVQLNAPDLAIGNLVGSNVFNPMLIVVMDLVYRHRPITNDMHGRPSHHLAAWGSIFFSIVILAEILSTQKFGLSLMGVFDVSLGMIVIIISYAIFIKILSKMDQNMIEDHEALDDKNMSLNKIILDIILSAAVVVISAIFLTQAADGLAIKYDLSQGLVGSIFLAFVTSLPEIVVSVAAMRLGSIDLAVGNIFGSNMMNLLIASGCDIIFRKGFILTHISISHVGTILLSIVISLIVLIGVSYKEKRNLLGLGWDSWLMIIVFIIGEFLIYQ